MKTRVKEQYKESMKQDLVLWKTKQYQQTQVIREHFTNLYCLETHNYQIKGDISNLNTYMSNEIEAVLISPQRKPRLGWNHCWMSLDF